MRQAVHSRGQFVAAARAAGRRIRVHTGTIDAAWQRLKAWLPSSLATSSRSGEFNPALDVYVWQRQWRFENAKRRDLSALTAKMYG